MKAILISIKPKYVADILNGEKTIEIRKTCPQVFKNLKPYEGAKLDVYIYCTKNGEKLYRNYKGLYWFLGKEWMPNEYNGKVVAKFTLNKVEKIIDKETKEKNHYSFGTETLQPNELEKMSCLNIQELCKYIGKGTRWQDGNYGYAWHIDNLEIFDEPKELSDFFVYSHTIDGVNEKNKPQKYDVLKRLNKAPQSYCYIKDVL